MSEFLASANNNIRSTKVEVEVSKEQNNNKILDWRFKKIPNWETIYKHYYDVRKSPEYFREKNNKQSNMYDSSSRSSSELNSDNEYYDNEHSDNYEDDYQKRYEDFLKEENKYIEYENEFSLGDLNPSIYLENEYIEDMENWIKSN